MSWILPVELLPFAGALALVVAWGRVNGPLSNAWLCAEVLLITLGIILIVSLTLMGGR